MNYIYISAYMSVKLMNDVSDNIYKLLIIIPQTFIGVRNNIAFINFGMKIDGRKNY